MLPVCCQRRLMKLMSPRGPHYIKLHVVIFTRFTHSLTLAWTNITEEKHTIPWHSCVLKIPDMILLNTCFFSPLKDKHREGWSYAWRQRVDEIFRPAGGSTHIFTSHLWEEEALKSPWRRAEPRALSVRLLWTFFFFFFISRAEQRGGWASKPFRLRLKADESPETPE